MYRFNGVPVLVRPESPTFYERIRREAFAKAKDLETAAANESKSAPAPSAEGSSAPSTDDTTDGTTVDTANDNAKDNADDNVGDNTGKKDTSV